TTIRAAPRWPTRRRLPRSPATATCRSAPPRSAPPRSAPPRPALTRPALTRSAPERADRLGEPGQRAVQLPGHLAHAEHPQHHTLGRARRLLPGAQPDPGAAVVRLQRDAKLGRRGEPGRRFAVQPLGEVPPGERPRRVVLDDLLIDLGLALAPVPVQSLA